MDIQDFTERKKITYNLDQLSVALLGVGCIGFAFGGIFRIFDDNYNNQFLSSASSILAGSGMLVGVVSIKDTTDENIKLANIGNGIVGSTLILLPLAMNLLPDNETVRTFVLTPILLAMPVGAVISVVGATKTT